MVTGLQRDFHHTSLTTETLTHRAPESPSEPVSPSPQPSGSAADGRRAVFEGRLSCAVLPCVSLLGPPSRDTQIGWLTQTGLSSHSSGGCKSKVKVLAGLVCSVASLLGLEMATSPCVLIRPFLCARTSRTFASVSRFSRGLHRKYTSAPACRASEPPLLPSAQGQLFYPIPWSLGITEKCLVHPFPGRGQQAPVGIVIFLENQVGRWAEKIFPRVLENTELAHAHLIQVLFLSRLSSPPLVCVPSSGFLSHSQVTHVKVASVTFFKSSHSLT